jgi:hypothetical protein
VKRIGGEVFIHHLLIYKNWREKRVVIEYIEFNIVVKK